MVKSRDNLFDNLKGFLIILVVFAHIIEYKNSGIFMYMRSAIYIFHMPLFVFISGYFSKNTAKKNYHIKNVENSLIPYFVFNTLYILLIGEFGFKEVFTPKFIYWYFFCLFLWRLILPLVSKFNGKAVVILSLLIAVAVGFFGVFDRFLSLSRIFAFFPYFIIGFYTDKEHISKIRGLNKIICALILAVMLILSATLYTNVFTVKSLENIQCYNSSNLTDISGATARVISIILALIICVCIINIANAKKSFLTVIGGRTSLIYPLSAFIQRIVTAILKSTPLYDKIYDSYALYFLFAVVLTVIIIAFCSNKFVFTLYKTAVNKVNLVIDKTANNVIAMIKKKNGVKND